MRREQTYAALFSLGVLLATSTLVLGHDEGAPHDHPGASMQSDPAAAFAMLVESVMRGKDTIEMAELSQYPDLFQFLTAPPKGRYEVKQLAFTKGDEVRAFSVAVHPPHDIFLMRGKEVGKDRFEGIYYVIDRTGWLKGAAAREGKTITEILRGDAWQAYEGEKAFWMWQAGQIAGSSQAGR